MNNDKLIVIVGETASGKSSLAMQLASRFSGEIICADSRTIYRGMDIGTAKPTSDDQATVPHHGLDLVNPDEAFSVSDFKEYASATIKDISSRGKMPMLVGGTGLYINAILYDYSFRPPADLKARKKLELLSVQELQDILKSREITLPNNPQNPRHLIRSIESNGFIPEANPLRSNTLIIGLTAERKILKKSIELRVEKMIEQGFIEEAERLGKKYGWEVQALQAPGYKAARQYIDGAMSLKEAKALFVKNDMNLAKRQRTWFGRNNSIQWVGTEEKMNKSVELITTFLNK